MASCDGFRRAADSSDAEPEKNIADASKEAKYREPAEAKFQAKPIDRQPHNNQRELDASSYRGYRAAVKDNEGIAGYSAIALDSNDDDNSPAPALTRSEGTERPADYGDLLRVKLFAEGSTDWNPTIVDRRALEEFDDTFNKHITREMIISWKP